MRDIQKYIADAPPAMTQFQMEKFAVGTEAPTYRYFFCCLQIKALSDKLTLAAYEVEARDTVEFQISTYANLAEKWYPLTNGKSLEELQPIIWDEKLSYDIALCLKFGGGGLGELTRAISAMPSNSLCQTMLNGKNMNQSSMMTAVENAINNFNIDDPTKYISLEDIVNTVMKLEGNINA